MIRPVRSLSDLGVRKPSGGRAETDFDDFDAHIGNGYGEISEIETALPLLRPNHPKSDRLLDRPVAHALQWDGRYTALNNALDPAPWGLVVPVAVLHSRQP